METITKTDGRQVVYYSTKETAVAVRASLRRAFPRVKFSVRIHLYSMGSSIYVGWTDGPTAPEVDRVLDAYTSKTFDGSDDSTHYHTQTVAGQEVQYSGSLSTRREHSPELRAMAEQRAARIGCDNVYQVLHTLRGDGVTVRVKHPWEMTPAAPVVNLATWKQAEGVH